MGEFVDIVVEDDRASIRFDGETYVIVMGVPPSAIPRSLKLTCSDAQRQNVDIEAKTSVSYQADNTTFALEYPISDGNGGNSFWVQRRFAKKTQ